MQATIDMFLAEQRANMEPVAVQPQALQPQALQPYALQPQALQPQNQLDVQRIEYTRDRQMRDQRSPKRYRKRDRSRDRIDTFLAEQRANMEPQNQLDVGVERKSYDNDRDRDRSRDRDYNRRGDRRLHDRRDSRDQDRRDRDYDRDNQDKERRVGDYRQRDRERDRYSPPYRRSDYHSDGDSEPRVPGMDSPQSQDSWADRSGGTADDRLDYAVRSTARWISNVSTNTIILRGLPTNVEEIDIRDELLDNNVSFKDIRLMKRKDTGNIRS